MKEPIGKRAKYAADTHVVSEHYRQAAFEYEKLGIEYSTNALKILTYLNGGALVALPAVVTLFKVDVAMAKPQLFFAGYCFVMGVLAVCVSHTLAFLCMSRRSEAENHFESEELFLIRAEHFPLQFDVAEAKTASQEHQKAGIKKLATSNRYRLLWIAHLWISVGLFLLGCIGGARSMLPG